tara:strand:- start:173 stop:463 length:291 start_codon:yes stop_codon:yes gene_type:complete
MNRQATSSGSIPRAVSFGSATINGIPAVPSLGMPGLMVCSALLILLTSFMTSKRELLDPRNADVMQAMREACVVKRKWMETWAGTVASGIFAMRRM